MYSVVTFYEHLTLMSVGLYSVWNDDQSTHRQSFHHGNVEPNRGTKDAPAFYKLYPRPHAGSTIFLRSRLYTSWLHFSIGRCMGQHLVHSKVWPSQFPIPSCHLARYLIGPSLSLVLLFTVWTQELSWIFSMFTPCACAKG